MSDKTSQDGALKALTDYLNGELAKEGITQDILDCVMLEVAYSPVIPYGGGDVEHAVEVRPWGFCADDKVPEKFELPDGRVVDQGSLKIMRARYLLRSKERMSPQVDAMFRRNEQGN